MPTEHSAIFVDLDGSLLHTDLLIESFFQLVKERPGLVPSFLTHLMKSKSEMKSWVADKTTLEIKTLPFREDLLVFLREEKRKGTKIILATASHEKWAEKVALHLDLFDHVIATSKSCNMKGAAKSEAIVSYCSQEGISDWTYVGDSRSDFPIWHASNSCILAGGTNKIESKLVASGKMLRRFHNKQNSAYAVLRALRAHQWIKNLLVFAPIFLAQRIDSEHLWNCIIAFVCFSMTASSVYVINDVMDVTSDRAHPKKKNRPFAAGALPQQWGLIIAFTLLCLSFSLSNLVLPITFSLILAGYLFLTTAYSVWLKKLPIVDVLVLASFYSIRIFAGAAVASVVVSEWLFAFSMFFFLSLAFVKRYSELQRMKSLGRLDAHGRGYSVTDLRLVETMGVTSGYLSVLVLALYINSANMKTFYENATALWAICPLLFFWIGRIWLLASKSLIDDDPLVFAMKDRVSLWVGVIGIALILVAL
jgi:4-hydroxybenzoate polyprenyltransferase/phosphoserine phosphatase